MDDPICGRDGSCFLVFDEVRNIWECVGPGPHCLDAQLLTGERSSVHDQPLIDATAAINAIFAAIPEDPDGRRASLIITSKGLFLAWVYHENAPDGDYTAMSDLDETTVVNALKLNLPA